MQDPGFQDHQLLSLPMKTGFCGSEFFFCLIYWVCVESLLQLSTEAEHQQQQQQIFDPGQHHYKIISPCISQNSFLHSEVLLLLIILDYSDRLQHNCS